MVNTLQRGQKATLPFTQAIDAYVRGQPGAIQDLKSAAEKVKQVLREIKTEVDGLTPPSSAEARAFHDAYQRLLDRQIQMWETDVAEMIRILEDNSRPPQARADEFDRILRKLQEQEAKDLAEVKAKQQAFGQAHHLNLK
jgi:hypothetical protein